MNKSHMIDVTSRWSWIVLLVLCAMAHQRGWAAEVPSPQPVNNLAIPTSDEPAGSSLPWFNHAAVQGVFVHQGSGNNLLAPEASWLPEFSWKNSIYFSPQFTFAIFKSSSLFLATSLIPTVQYAILPRWSLNAGAGIQTWWGNLGTRFTTEIGGSYTFEKSPWAHMDRVVFGYNLFFKSNDLTQSFHVGMGFHI